MKKFFRELWVRVKLGVPPFFRKVQAIGGTVMAAGLSFTPVDKTIGVGLFMGGLASVIVSQFVSKEHSDKVIERVVEKSVEKESLKTKP